MAIENGILKLSGVIKLRGGTAENLASVNPVLQEREIMIETDTGKIKVGKAIDNWGEEILFHWNDLPYADGWLSEELESISSNIDKTVLHNSIKADNFIANEDALTGIANGSFSNMWIGTGIGNGRSGYMILDMNYFYGIDGCDTPHVVVTPYGTASMAIINSVSSFASGGYYGFTELRTLLASYVNEAVEFFGAEHVMTHREYLCDGIANGEPSSYNWYNSQCELMTLQQVYGGRSYSPSALSDLSGYKQFSYYRLSRGFEYVTPHALRNVASANSLWSAENEACPAIVTLEDEMSLSFTPYLCIC